LFSRLYITVPSSLPSTRCINGSAFGPTAVRSKLTQAETLYTPYTPHVPDSYLGHDKSPTSKLLQFSKMSAGNYWDTHLQVCRFGYMQTRNSARCSLGAMLVCRDVNDFRKTVASRKTGFALIRDKIHAY